MSPSHSNLHFVNVSKPNGGKDEETRRAVRTHVMQQYIQKRRLQEKRRASHTPLERAAQLPCVCLTTKAVPQPFGTSSGRHKSGFGICPECRGRRWAITNTGRDGSDGGILAQEQAVNRFSSRGPPDHPATLLGAGRVDPFGVYPVEAQPYMHDLLDHCMCCSLTALLASLHGPISGRFWEKPSFELLRYIFPYIGGIDELYRRRGASSVLIQSISLYF